MASMMTSTTKIKKQQAAGESLQPETFEQCIKHYGLTDEALTKKRRLHLYTAMGCLLGSVVLLAYTLYLIATGIYFSSLVSVMLAALLVAYAYREHFNAFQIKQRRLGCTFKEWVSYTFKGGK